MLSRAADARDAATFVLAVVSGATDAIGFVALGGAFTSVMTGNMVLTGLAIGRGDGTLARHALIALVAFVLGCAVGARVAGKAVTGQPTWPPQLNRALALEGVAFVAVAIGWWVSGSRPGDSLQPVLLALNALALGVQSSAIQRFGVAGLSTTYMTGTLTTMVLRLATGGGVREALPNLRLLVGLIAGAALGAVLAVHAAAATPLIALVGVAVVGALALQVRRGAAVTATRADSPVTS